MSKDGIVLTAEKRTEVGKGPTGRLRAAGSVPVVVYGHGKASVTLAVSARELAQYVHHTGLLKLQVEGRSRPVSAIIKDVQYNHVKGTVEHVDFLEVRADEVISATVAVESHGIAVGQSRGGIMEQVLHQIELRCAANKLPSTVVVDISGLDLDQAIHVRDLILPESAVATVDPDQIVFSLALPRVEEEAVEEGVVGEEGEGVEGEEGEAAVDGGAADGQSVGE